MIDVNLFFYVGIFLAIVGSLATAWGPGVKDPIIRTFNTEVASIGVCLVLLTYNHVLALLTKNTKQLIMIGDHKQLRPKPYK